jgi:hypothetical protein
MSEVSESAKPSKITRLRKRADELRLVGGAYLSLESRLYQEKMQPVPKEVVDAYEENRTEIENLFGRERPKDLLYHGTGNLQYAGDKYNGGLTGELRHPLNAILEHGIHPHLDVWNSAAGGYNSSSIATTWPYAKVYADFHQSPQNSLAWEYGDKTDWLSYFMAATTVAHGKDYVKRGIKTPRKVLQELREARRGMKVNKSQGDLNRLQSWISYVRKPSPNETARQIFNSKTDIPDNFGAVIIVDPKGVNVAPKGPGVYEVRTLDPIPPDNFLVLAVPLDKVEEMRRKVFQLELNIPILPTETVDYHMSQFPFDELTKKRRIPVRRVSPK